MRPTGFPDDFWWGTGASSTQTEGAAPRSDWYAWERGGHGRRASGDGNGFATRYAEDFQLFAEHGLTHHRLSLEWARLEPEPGRHDPAAVEHYRAGADAPPATPGSRCGPACTTSPCPAGSARTRAASSTDQARGCYWHRHVDWVAETFGDLIFGWKPINEPRRLRPARLAARACTRPGVADDGPFAEALRGDPPGQPRGLAPAAQRRPAGGHDPQPHPRCIAAVRSTEPATSATQADERARRFDDVTWCWTRALRDGVLAGAGPAAIEIPDMAGSFDLVGFSLLLRPDRVRRRHSGPTRPTPGSAPWGTPRGPRGSASCCAGWPTSCPAGPAGRRVRRRHRRRRRGGVGCCATASTRSSWRVDDGIDIRGFFHWTGVDNYEWDYGFDVAFGLFDRDRNAQGQRRAGPGVGHRRARAEPPVLGGRPPPCEAEVMSEPPAKEAAGRHAAGYVTDGMRVGLGTGSTVHFTIVALGERGPRHRLHRHLGADRRAGPLARAQGGDPRRDRRARHRHRRRRRGRPRASTSPRAAGAPTPARSSWPRWRPRFVVVVDESKLVAHLGPFGTPLEVLDFAPAVVAGRVQALGATDVTTRDASQRQRQPADGRRLRHHRRPGGAGRRAGRRPRHRRARHLPRRHGRAGGRRRPCAACTSCQHLTRPSGRREAGGSTPISESGTGRGRRRLPC